VPFTMIKRSMAAAGAGLLAAALLGRRAKRDQRTADVWNQTKLAHGVTIRGRRVLLRAPRKVGARGTRGRWRWETAPVHARRGLRRIRLPFRRSAAPADGIRQTIPRSGRNHTGRITSRGFPHCYPKLGKTFNRPHTVLQRPYDGRQRRRFAGICGKLPHPSRHTTVERFLQH
jgi:hypothetical protein